MNTISKLFSNLMEVQDVRRGHIPSLDGARAISIAFVIIGHTTNMYQFHRYHSIGVLGSQLAYLGVVIFFVISGFLITSLMLDEQARTGHIDRAAFFRRRFFRIIPAAFAYIVFATVFYTSTITPTDIFIALSFTTSYFVATAFTPLHHLWSLSVEEQFYLILPFVMKAKISRAKAACWAALIICPLARLYCFYHHLEYPRYYFPTVLDSLSVGCLVAFYRQSVWQFLRRFQPAVLSLGGLISALALVYGLEKIPFLGVWFSGGIAGSVAVALLTAVENRFSFLNIRAVAWIGTLSYSIYLWQQPFLLANGEPPKHVFLKLLGIIPAALCSHYLIEKPMLKFKTPRSKTRRASIAVSEACVQVLD